MAESKHLILLTSLRGEGSVEQVEALVSERFIGVKMKSERRGVDSLFAAV